MSMLSACRLVKELWLAGAATLAEGNALLPAFIADYNARFAKAPANNKDATVAGENCDRKKNCSAKIASRRGEDAHAHLRMGVTFIPGIPRGPKPSAMSFQGRDGTGQSANMRPMQKLAYWASRLRTAS